MTRRRHRARSGRRAATLLVLGATVVTGVLAHGDGADADAVAFTERERRRLLAMSPVPPPPPDPTNAWADDPAAARFGQALFFTPRLSADGNVSCAVCHDSGRAFTDGERLGSALGEMTRHTMGLLDVAHQRWFFWDGRADSLWAQALEPLEEPREHGMTRVGCVRAVHDDPDLRHAYETVFGPLPDLDDDERFPAAARPVPGDDDHPHAGAWAAMADADRAAIDRAFVHLGKAIAAYERRLVAGPAPFDVFVAGLRANDRDRIDTISPAAQRGAKLFVGPANCRLCHFGPRFTDDEFHATGVGPLAGGPLRDAGRYEGVQRLRANPFAATGPHSDDPAGAAADRTRSVASSVESWGQFKTPSLRNVARTAPYMHQGQIDTLEDVIRHYSTLENAVLPGHHHEQLLVPLNLTPREIADLAAFLRSLTSDDPESALLRPPARTTPERTEVEGDEAGK